MSTSTQRFVLVGPHKGKTLVLNGSHEFVDGVYDFQGSHEQIATLTRIFSFYGAVTEQEAELEGLRAQVQSQASAAPIPEPTNLVEAIQKAPAEEVVQAHEQTAAAAAAGVEGASEAAAKLSLAEAIGQLDPENDAHWTSNNLPSLDYLATLTGKKIARGDVDAVADGYTRAKARAARA